MRYAARTFSDLIHPRRKIRNRGCKSVFPKLSALDRVPEALRAWSVPFGESKSRYHLPAGQSSLYSRLFGWTRSKMSLFDPKKPYPLTALREVVCRPAGQMTLRLHFLSNYEKNLKNFQFSVRFSWKWLIQLWKLTQFKFEGFPIFWTLLKRMCTCKKKTKNAAWKVLVISQVYLHDSEWNR